jgi:hypothetical protein
MGLWGMKRRKHAEATLDQLNGQDREKAGPDSLRTGFFVWGRSDGTRRKPLSAFFTVCLRDKRSRSTLPLLDYFVWMSVLVVDERRELLHVWRGL